MSNTRKATVTPSKTASGSRKAAKPKPPPPDLDTLLGEDDRAEDVVPLCLRGNLLARWHDLKAQYDAGPGDDDQAMMHERAAKRKIADQMAQVEAEMRAGTVAFRLRALPRKRLQGMSDDETTWHELLQAHPPRKDKNGKVVKEDAGAGVNTATFFDALVRTSVVEPQMDDARWERLNAKLTDGQFQKLAAAAWALNRDDIDVPFSRAVSMMRKLDAESRRQNDSASPSDGSTAGSPST